MSEKPDWEPFREAFGQDRWIALDPGNTHTGWVAVTEDDSLMGHLKIWSRGHLKNNLIRQAMHHFSNYHSCQLLLIECPRPRGQLMASEEMEMLIEIGRFLQMWRGPWSYVFRGDVKHNLIGTTKGGDAPVSRAIKERFGGEVRAVGGKRCKRCHGKKVIGALRCPVCLKKSKTNNTCERCSGGADKSGWTREQCGECEGSGWAQKPGPLYGVTEHAWAALGVACWWQDSGRVFQKEVAGKQPKRKKKSVDNSGSQ